MQGRTCVLFTSSWEWFLTYSRRNDICQLKGWICYFPVALIPWQKLLREGTVYFGLQFEAAVMMVGKARQQDPEAAVHCVLSQWSGEGWMLVLSSLLLSGAALSGRWIFPPSVNLHWLTPHRCLQRLTWSKVCLEAFLQMILLCQRQSILTSHNLKKEVLLFLLWVETRFLILLNVW